MRERKRKHCWTLLFIFYHNFLYAAVQNNNIWIHQRNKNLSNIWSHVVVFFSWFTQYLSVWVYKPLVKHKGCARVSNDWLSDLQTDWLNGAGKMSENAFTGMALPALSGQLTYRLCDWLTNTQTVCGSGVEPSCMCSNFIFSNKKNQLSLSPFLCSWTNSNWSAALVS